MTIQGDSAANGVVMMMADNAGLAKAISAANSLPMVDGNNGLPTGAASVNASSGNVANAPAVATMPAAAAKTNYITGFEISSSGATVGLPVVVTVAGILGGALSYIFAAPAGALVGAFPLMIEFPRPIPASAVNTAITVTCPALGAGNTNAAAVIHGYVV